MLRLGFSEDIYARLHRVPFGVPVSKEAVLYWGPKKGPQFRELPLLIIYSFEKG